MVPLFKLKGSLLGERVEKEVRVIRREICAKVGAPYFVSFTRFHFGINSEGPRLTAHVEEIGGVRHTKKKTKLRGLSPLANYTDRATATVQRS
jgi:hypothetical protein